MQIPKWEENTEQTIHPNDAHQTDDTENAIDGNGLDEETVNEANRLDLREEDNEEWDENEELKENCANGAKAN
jgi:hypothetical protein